MSLPIVRLSARERSSAPADTASLTSGGTVIPEPKTSRTTFPYCWSFKRQSRGGANAIAGRQGSGWAVVPVVLVDPPFELGPADGAAAPPGLVVGSCVPPIDPVQPSDAATAKARPAVP